MDIWALYIWVEISMEMFYTILTLAGSLWLQLSAIQLADPKSIIWAYLQLEKLSDQISN